MDVLNKCCIILSALAFTILIASSQADIVTVYSEGCSQMSNQSEIGNIPDHNPLLNGSQGNGTGYLSNLKSWQMTGFLTPGEAYGMIQNGSVVIDVRTPDEYEQGHIEDAINIDCYSEDFLVRLKSLNRNSTYIVYCKMGYRGGIALEAMKALGFKEVYNIAGGVARWSGDGYPLVLCHSQEWLSDRLENI